MNETSLVQSQHGTKQKINESPWNRWVVSFTRKGEGVVDNEWWEYHVQTKLASTPQRRKSALNIDLAMTMTFDFWPWTTILSMATHMKITLPSFIEIPQLSEEIPRHAE